MKITLQKDNQFGEDGPQSGDVLYLTEIRKIDGEFWAYAVKLVAQDTFSGPYIIQLDDLLIWNTENTEPYGSTRA